MPALSTQVCVQHCMYFSNYIAAGPTAAKGIMLPNQRNVNAVLHVQTTGDHLATIIYAASLHVCFVNE